MKILEYAIGDIHGMLDLFESSISIIHKHAERHDAAPKFILLGDYVDRGPSSREVVERIIALVQTDDVVAICGNHETMMFEALSNWHNGAPKSWLDNGGHQTMKSYGGNPDCVDVAHLSWMRSLPSFHETPLRFYVHAGVDPTLPIDAQSDGNYQWIRGKFLGHWGTFSNSHGVEKYVVHGHSINVYGPDIQPNRCNLDIGSFHINKIAVGVFDPEIPGRPVETMIVGANGLISASRRII